MNSMESEVRGTAGWAKSPKPSRFRWDRAIGAGVVEGEGEGQVSASSRAVQAISVTTASQRSRYQGRAGLEVGW